MAPADESDGVRAPLSHSAWTGYTVRPKQKAFSAFAYIYNAVFTIQTVLGTIRHLQSAQLFQLMEYIGASCHLNSIV